MFGLRGQELLIILLIVLLIFGASKLPALARSLGSSAKEFRKGIEEGAADDEVKAEATDTESTDTTTTDTPPPDS